MTQIRLILAMIIMSTFLAFGWGCAAKAAKPESVKTAKTDQSIKLPVSDGRSSEASGKSATVKTDIKKSRGVAQLPPVVGKTAAPVSGAMKTAAPLSPTPTIVKKDVLKTEDAATEKATVKEKKDLVKAPLSKSLKDESLAYTQAVEDEELNLPLQPGDKLDIFIWDNPDLSQTVVIAPNGYFPFPMLNQVKAQGLTVTELQQKLTELLAQGYLVNPSVKITVLERRSRYFYVFGEVQRPQRLQYPLGEKITIMMAITMAGGLTDKASDQKIRVIRRKDEEKKEILVKMQDEILPGDIIIVPQALF